MSKQRKEIWTKVVKILKGRRLADNIVGCRSVATWNDNLPAISVYPVSEDVEELDQSPRRMKRTIDLLIEVKVKGKDEQDAAECLDDLCDDIENCLTIDDSIDCLADDILLKTARFEYDSEGSSNIAFAGLVFSVEYYKYMPPDQAGQGLRDLNGADANWDVGTANDPDPEATDQIDIPPP